MDLPKRGAAKPLHREEIRTEEQGEKVLESGDARAGCRRRPHARRTGGRRDRIPGYGLRVRRAGAHHRGWWVGHDLRRDAFALPAVHEEFTVVVWSASPGRWCRCGREHEP